MRTGTVPVSGQTKTFATSRPLLCKNLESVSSKPVALLSIVLIGNPSTTISVCGGITVNSETAILQHLA